MFCAPTASWAASGVPAERAAATFATTPLSAPALAFTGPVAWGANRYGQLGDGKSGPENNSLVPVALSGVGEVVALAAGYRHSLALLANGTVLAWGYNGQGQLGNGNTTSSDVPVAVQGLTEVAAIAAGEDSSLALLTNGTVMSWGSDEWGQLGNGTSGGPNHSDVPVQVSGLTEVTAISAGDGHSLALLKNGTVMSWGRNVRGELGTGSSVGPETCPFGPCAMKPVAVSSLSGVASIAAGGEHSLAVLGSGAVMAWGANSNGQLGTGSSAGPETCSQGASCATKPVAVTGLTEATAASGGLYFSLALQKSGAVVAWGENSGGRLGDGVTEGPEHCSGNVECSTKPVPVSGLTEAASISAGSWFSLARLKSGGVVAWGEGGALGTGTNGSGTCECATTPVHVDGLSGTTAVSAGGSHALALGTLAPIPTITGVEPNDGPAAGGTSVTITGTNLSEVNAVKFGSANATSFKVESETKISAISPPGAGVVDVTVATANATSPITSADHFDYAPTVTHVEPNDGPAAGGTAVTITGTNFSEVSAVKFGSTNATSFKVESVGKIAAVAPAGTGSVDVTVTSAGGTSPTGASDLFDYAPTVTHVEPNSGAAAGGTSVTITGTNFNEVSAVKFGPNTAASVTVNSPTSITAHSPAGSSTVNVFVTTAGGTSPASEADYFTYGPELTAISPTYGSPGGGTSVTITGNRFSGATAVKFGSANATSFKVESATSITAVSPSGTGTVEVTVTTPEGTSPGDQFDYRPTVTKLEPRNGANAGGTSVEIIGTNFNEVEAVKFGSTNVTFTRNSETSITAVSPPWAGGSARVRVSVTTKGGVNPEPAATILGPEYFGYAPTVTRVSPNAGPAAGGTLVMIGGGAFESIRNADEFPPFVASVKFGSTNATSFTVSSEGSIINAVAPAGTGTVDVTVETGAGTSLTSSTDHFTFTPTAPTVATTAATSVTRTLATMNGTVNPNSGNVTECKFEYGTTTSYGSTAPCASLPGSGASPVTVAASPGSFSPGTTYHYRISATNTGGTSTGADQSFTTLAALPTPHWYKNAMKVALGEKSPLIGWGTLTLESSAGTATCHTAQAANVENTAGAATKEVVLFAAFECKQVGGSCTAGEQRATPGHLPWQGTMLEEGVEGSGEFREEGWGIELNLECFKGGVNTANQLFKTGPVLAETGTFTPRWLNGTSATKPSEAFFDLASGHLDAEVEKAAVKGTTKGKLKFVGYQDNSPVPLFTLAKP